MGQKGSERRRRRRAKWLLLVPILLLVGAKGHAEVHGDGWAVAMTALASERAQLGPAPAGDELPALRHRYLRTQLSSLRARVRMLQGQRFTFDEESKALYDAVAPTHPEAHFQAVLDRLEQRARRGGHRRPPPPRA